GWFIAMHDAKFSKTHRQVAVALQAVLEDLHMPGTVHRLDGEPALVLRLVTGRLRGEHVLAVPAPVARGLPQRLVEHLWRVHRVVVAGEAAAHVGNDLLEDGPAFRVPEHHARTFLLEVEE